MSTKVYTPSGMLGYGFPEASLHAAMEQGPDVIAIDAGSIDPGPYYLGAGKGFTNETMVQRDLSLILPAALDAGIPTLIGSAGGSGARPHLDATVHLIRQLAADLGLRFKMAVIASDIPAELVVDAIEAGEVIDFEAGHELTADDVHSCSNLVGQMGYEPFVEALRAGADVVVAGRAYDAAVIAALPILEGADIGAAMHMGKIAECGSLVALPRTTDGVVAEVFDDRFEIEPADPNKWCSVDLVAAHTLYEKSDPYILKLPGGHLNLREVVYEQLDDRRVGARGSKFVKDPFTIKLEGSALVGYRSVCIAGVRDPILIRQIDELLEAVREKLRDNLTGRIDESDYTLQFRVYGRDAVMGQSEPTPQADTHEIGLIIDATANTQAKADTVAALARSATLHTGYEGRKATAGNLAFPYSPAEFAAPAAYEFRVHHLLRTDSATDLFPITWEDVDGNA